jgi:hypothetical protein
MLIFWLVTRRVFAFLRNILGLKSVSPEDGGNMFLRNAGMYLQVDTASLPGRPISIFSVNEKFLDLIIICTEI